MTPTGPDLLATLNALLREALALGGAERDAYLARLRQERPEHATELAALIAAEAALDARRFMTGGRWSRDGIGSGLAGHRLGGWTLDRPLGQGGMGTVWLARRSDGRFEGTAAIKLLNLALLDPVGAERFRREGTVLARLSHPNIARLLDAGLNENGQPYLVLEHVEGQRIDRYCDEHRLSPESRLRLFLQVLAAVAHAHANLIVHRDIKPSNILVTADGTVKLLDFGIAKLLEDGSVPSDRTEATDTGRPPLTPQYAAPEQVTGSPITTATDIYALGGLLYLLLAGRHPTGTPAMGLADHLRAVVETEPPLLSVAVAAGEPQVANSRAGTRDRLRRLYRGDLDNIAAKSIRKDPRERYATVGAFADDLRRYLDFEPVHARPDSWRYRAGKFVRRNRGTVAAAAVAGLALLGAVARERTLRERAQAETRRALAVEDYLVSVFGGADPFAPPDLRPPELTARALLDRGVARIDTALAGQPEVRASLRTALGRVYSNLGVFDRAAEELASSLDERRALFGPRHPTVAEVMDLLGQARFRQGRLEEADTLLRGALALRRQLLGNRHEATAGSMEHLAQLLRDRNQFPEAEALLREAMEVRVALYGAGGLPVAESKQALAQLLFWKGEYSEAVAFYNEALAIQSRLLGEDHPATAETMQSLGQAHQLRGQFALAETLYRRSLAAKRKALGDAHPGTTVTMSNLAQLLSRELGKVDEAEALLRESLALNRQLFGERHSYVGDDLSQLAAVLQFRGDFVEAERLNREALAISRSIYGQEHEQVAFILNSLAWLLLLQGKADEAAPVFRDAATQYRHLMGDNHRYTLGVTANLARALSEAGRLAEAERTFRDVVARLEAGHQEDRVPLLGAQVGLGRTLTRMGRPAEALRLIEAAVAPLQQRFGDNGWRTAEARLGVGESHLALRDYANAEPMLRQAFAALQPQSRTQPILAAQARTALERLARASGSRGPPERKDPPGGR